MPTTTSATPYEQRASRTPHPLSAYLLRLMALKRSNLALSADVGTAAALLALAARCGPHIVVLKTHYDLVAGWDYHPVTGTGARLARLARQHGFLIFEDRKLADIGNTVQLQYTAGTARIIDWAHIVNVHMMPGRAAVGALATAAARWRERKRCEVRTSIEGGTGAEEQGDAELVNGKEETEPAHEPETSEGTGASWPLDARAQGAAQGRKASIVSITTLSQSFERADSPRQKSADDDVDLFPGIEEAPLERGLLILAQMSTEGHFLDAAYTQACVETARQHADFVMGFIAMEDLNSQPSDAFLSMAPGCQLPPRRDNGDEPDEHTAVQGDGKGQVYRTPRNLVLDKGIDVVIVGRGIYKADDPKEEAERYQWKAWAAYQERTGQA